MHRFYAFAWFEEALRCMKPRPCRHKLAFGRLWRRPRGAPRGLLLLFYGDGWSPDAKMHRFYAFAWLEAARGAGTLAPVDKNELSGAAEEARRSPKVTTTTYFTILSQRYSKGSFYGDVFYYILTLFFYGPLNIWRTQIYRRAVFYVSKRMSTHNHTCFTYDQPHSSPKVTTTTYFYDTISRVFKR